MVLEKTTWAIEERPAEIKLGEKGPQNNFPAAAAMSAG